VSAPVVAAAALRGRAVVPPEHVAYEVYLDHQKQCSQCGTSLFVCPAGVDLWEAFKAAIPPARVPAWLQS
jgi:CO dehydrogenase/acetyl-CoA synthase alpha subunit